MSVWDHSSFLDLTGYGLTTASTPEQAFSIRNPTVATGSITVGLVLPRTTDPTALLGRNWAGREAQLNGLTPDEVGALYGADPARYAALQAYVKTVTGATLLSSDQGYVSSAQSRTLWVSLDTRAFDTLFGQQLLSPAANANFVYWDGTLTPNAALGSLAGLWPVSTAQPNATPQDTNGVTLTPGPQGVGNTAGGGYGHAATLPSQQLYPNQIASEYNFPLANSNLATPTIGLLEPGIGAAVNQGDDANQLLQQYRASAGVSGTGTIVDGPVQPAYPVPTGEERSLDVGVVAAAAPNSDMVAEAGAGVGNPYSAVEEAVWGGGPKLADLSSSFRIGTRVNPASPFFAALQGLYQDVALNNVSLFQASGDGGSSALLATGVPEVNTSNVSTYSISVGGTSTSSQAQVAAAGAADTGGAPNVNAGIAALAQQAQAGDVNALETLVAGGLTQRPTASSNIAAFLQTTWNAYNYNASTQTLTSYSGNYASGGGVDTAIPEPSYQSDAGIDTQALAQAAGIPDAASGKGDPDVSALAGGNTHYIVPGPDLTGTQPGEGGTSASAPLWAALTAKIQTVFADQGLPGTGYFNDLLYQAATVDPGAFDDVRFGSNTSSYYLNANSPILQRNPNGTESPITPTGLGYSAGPSYDLTTGLGTPNGILLARALTQVAQAEIYNPDATPVTDATGATSAADQVLIVQPTLTSSFSGTVTAGGTAFTPAGNGSGLGWSARIAQQTLQSTFDPALARAIAGQSQASSIQITVANGQALSVGIGGAAATPIAQADTASFGFVSYGADGRSVTLARPLAVAETYGGKDGTTAIVRVRQNSADADSLSFYRVDDLAGSIGGVAPGQAGYAAAAASRNYTTTGGMTSIAGPGDGQFLQTDISGVNNGDVIGFELIDATSGRTTWGLASQNAGGGNGLWSYGADTWGLDDGTAGDDAHDSMVFQLDFTSNAGSGLVASDAPVCFAAGTLIRTARGDVAVEALAVGDLVVTGDGVERPIRWLGHRTVDCARSPRRHEVLPVRIAAHAFGAGRPARDLRVSPGHAICVDVVGEVLIPASALVNGTTIVQEQVDSVTYWHVELQGGHDVILAENLPCESYLDMGNRGFFAEAGVTALHAAPDASVVTHADFCRPFHGDGPVVAFVRARLAARSPDLGWRLEEAPFADLHLVVDGRRVEPETSELAARFLVPAGAREVWLVSDTSVPAEIGLAPDLRALGVCLGRLVVDDGFGSPRTIAADDARLGVGFHHLEDGPQRWTAGRARLAADLWHGCRGSFFLRVELTRPALPRWVAPAGPAYEEALAGHGG